MPIYEYECGKCEREIEVEQRITEDPIKTCPHCKSRKVKRLISQTSFVLKGGGWYSDLYSSSKDSKSSDKDSGAGDSGASDSGASDSGSGDSGGDDSGGGKSEKSEKSSKSEKKDKKTSKGKKGGKAAA